MEYNRNKIIDRINELKRHSGRYGSGNRITNKTIAEYIGKTERTVSDWLQKRPSYKAEDEGGYPDIPLKDILKLCDLFDCDIEYLLGEYDCKHKTEEDIHRVTGLDETSINILKDSLFYTRNEYSQYDEPEEVFLKLINKIIQSHSVDNLSTSLDELKPDTFPISHISEYIAKSIRYANLKKNACFDTLSNIDEGIRKNLYDSIAEGLKVVEGYTDEEIENLRPLIREYQALTDFKEHSRYERIDIQDAFSRFLISEYVETMGVK